jgi:ferrous iron transport protein A
MGTVMSELREGERGTVLALRLPPERTAPLTRLGLLPGTEVLCLRRSPLGDPTAYRFRGTTVALRRQDCACISLKEGIACNTP